LSPVFVSLYGADDRLIVATPGSPFYRSLGCNIADFNAILEQCQGPASQWIRVSFPAYFNRCTEYGWSFLYLFGVLALTRVVLGIALFLKQCRGRRQQRSRWQY